METVQMQIHNMAMDWSSQVQNRLKNCDGNLLTFLRSPINDNDVEEYTALSTKYNVSVDNPIYADLINLRACSRAESDCAKCIKKSGNCYKISLRVLDNRIKCVRTLCNNTLVDEIIRRADVPLKFRNVRISDWEINEYNFTATQVAFDSVHNNKGLFISGKAGCGKTMLCSIVINERAYMNKRSHFYTVTDLLDELRDFDNPLRRAEKLKSVQTCPCLVIDDLGAEYQTEWVASMLFSILDARYKKDLMTIINSNFSLDYLCDRIKGYHGERIVRRIKALCDVTSIN